VNRIVTTESRSEESIGMTYDYRMVNGKTLISFYLPKVRTYQGMQLELSFPEEAMVSQLLMDQLELQSRDILILKEKNAIRISHNVQNATSIDNSQALFKVVLGGELEEGKVRLTKDWMSSEIYMDGIARSLSLEGKGIVTPEIVVYQNEPNPWTQSTTIKFEIPKDDEVSIQVFDNSGRVVWSKKGFYSKGLNTEVIKDEEIPYSGILIYEIAYGDEIVRNKMIHLR